MIDNLLRRYDEQRNQSVSHLRERLRQIDINWTESQRPLNQYLL